MKCPRCDSVLEYVGTARHNCLQEVRTYRYYVCPICEYQDKKVTRTPTREVLNETRNV